MPTRQPLRVLVAEDEYLLADDIASWLERAGATVIGPLPSVERTLKSLSATPEIDVAVLDINLNGELIYPVADELARRAVPVVFFTGYDEIDVPERFSTALTVSKTASVSDLLNAVFEQRLKTMSGLTPMRPEAPEERVLELVPGLRLRARLLLSTPRAADRLVERTLEKAIAEVSSRGDGQPLDAWLHQIMLSIFAEAPFGPN
jgi:CheY-like chemotaxis protein